MVVKRQCSFCAAEIEPGTGSMYVKRDGTVYHFDTSSCRKQQLNLGRVGHRLKWTRAHSLKRAADRSSEASRTAARAAAALPAKPAAKVRVPKAPPAPTGGETPATPAGPAPAAAVSAVSSPPAKKPAPRTSPKEGAPADAAAETPQKPKPRTRAKKSAESPPGKP